MDVTWPRIEDPVAVSASSWPGWLRTRIEEARAPDFVLSAPGPARVGDTLVLRWRIPRGLAQVEAKVLSVQPGAHPTWHVQAVGQAWLSQRRRFARVNVVRQAVLSMGEDEASRQATVVDIGEGGMRCHAQHLDVALHDHVEAEVHVLEPPLVAAAEVVRVEAAPRAGSVLGLRFVNLARRDADRLRKFVFAEQSRQRWREKG